MRLSCFIWHRFCFFKQKTANEVRISDWSSDVCSSDLLAAGRHIDTAPDRCAELDTAGLAAEIVDGHRGVIAALAGIHRIAGARLEIGLPRLRRDRKSVV